MSPRLLPMLQIAILTLRLPTTWPMILTALLARRKPSPTCVCGASTELSVLLCPTFGKGKPSTWTAPDLDWAQSEDRWQDDGGQGDLDYPLE